ncbi:MAG: class I SAM-dependent methyltransferase [Oscillospiraceae bacterium]|nr:class I SAM-dependent methyltransferase [Oscillospiraceae bacterium]
MFNWKEDIFKQPIETMFLLEEHQLKYLASGELREDLAIILKAHPSIEWYMRNKAPATNAWLDELMTKHQNVPIPSMDELREIEKAVIGSMEDWIIYATTPDDYHKQPFNRWEESELTELTDYSGKIVVDIGSGTGKQAFAVAPLCKTVFCVEPVHNLRKYLKEKARRENLADKIFIVDGLLEDIPFPDGFADVVMGGHVFGDDPESEIAEMTRVAKTGGMIILCPGSADNADSESESHRVLLANGFEWSRFLEPGDVIGSGWKRKYWKTVD